MSIGRSLARVTRKLEESLVLREKIPGRILSGPPGELQRRPCAFPLTASLPPSLSLFYYVFQSSVGQLTIITSDVPRPRDWRVKM